jgi:fluoride exporter
MAFTRVIAYSGKGCIFSNIIPRNKPMKPLWIGAGAFLGANLRYFLQTWTANRWGPGFPYGTLIINVSGSFVLGFFITLVTQRVVVSSEWRAFVAVGLLGGFTTFSSFSVETLNLLQTGRWLAAAANLGGNVCLGLVGAYLGVILARAV